MKKGVYYSKQKINCYFCGGEFFQYPSCIKRSKNNFCSRYCYSEYRKSSESEERVCEGCQRTFRALKRYLKRGEARFCSRSCAIKIKTLNLWKDPVWAEKQRELLLSALFKRPTSLERDMIALIEQYNLPYKYVGNGKFWIGHKNPDFVHNDQRVLIEVANTIHHSPQYKKERTDFFAKYGWKSYVFMGNTLDREEVLKTLK